MHASKGKWRGDRCFVHAQGRKGLAFSPTSVMGGNFLMNISPCGLYVI